ncbi:MAG: hypothetical protein ACR2QC_03140 [Gammaproteobacteria bacterium]
MCAFFVCLVVVGGLVVYGFSSTHDDVTAIADVEAFYKSIGIVPGAEHTPARVVQNDMERVHGTVKFFTVFPGNVTVYFNALSISNLAAGFKTHVMGNYQGLLPREYNYEVYVYDPDGELSGANVGYRGVFTPDVAGNYWYQVSFWAEDVLARPGVWRIEVVLTDTTSGRRFVLSRDLPVAD